MKFASGIAAATALAAILCLADTAAAQAADKTLPLSARTKGSATAPVTVYEMADFQCPVCRRFVMEMWPTIEKQYIATGKVRWIYIMYPLTQIHQNAAAAAMFAACAGVQGKFWPAHDMLFTTQESWEKLKDPAPFFQSKSAGLGLKSDAIASCIQSGSAAAMVSDDASGAERSGANSTPTFYIEGGIMAGLYPLATFQQVLDSIWKAKTKK
jgi:protein-disulfide isomerase